MKISVIIPCYNAERWIEQTLESVGQQSVPPHEVVVIDDGSTDKSLDYINSSSVPTKVLQTPHAGPAAARNAGIEVTTGDWVAFLDADDWWKPDHLQRIKSLVADSTDTVYLAAAEHYSINVNRIVSMSDTASFTQPTANLDHKTYFQLYLKHGLLELSSSAVRRDRLEAIGGFDLQMRGAEDFDLILRAIHHSTWAYDPVPSSIYRCNNPESHSRKFALDEMCLTAKFRVFMKNRDAYSVPNSLLRDVGRTLMSKAIIGCDSQTRQRVRKLVNPYLSPSQQKIFAIASTFPKLYQFANDLKNRFKGPQYGPRKVIPNS